MTDGKKVVRFPIIGAKIPREPAERPGCARRRIFSINLAVAVSGLVLALAGRHLPNLVPGLSPDASGLAVVVGLIVFGAAMWRHFMR